MISISGQNPFDLRQSSSNEAKDTMESQVPKDLADTNRPAAAIDQKASDSIVTSTELSDQSSSSSNPFDIVISRGNATKKRTSKVTESAKNEEITTAVKVKKRDKKSSTASPKPFIKGKIWPLLYCFLILGLLAFLVSYNRELLSQIFRAMINTNTLKIVFRENYLVSKWLFGVYYVLFFLTLPFIIYKFIKLKVDLDIVYLLPLTIGFVALWYGLRHLVNYFFLNLTNEPFDLSFYNYQVIVSNITLGVILIPLVFALAIGNDNFSDFVLIISFALIALFYLYRQLRAMVLGSGLIARSTFHFFIYLCAVEIMPLLLVGKFVTTL